MAADIIEYLDDNKFVNIPKILGDSLEYELFPGYLKNIEEIRTTDFPLFGERGRIYLDNGATTQEPQSVKDHMQDYRRNHMRGSNHSLNSHEAQEAQELWVEAKRKVSDFFGASEYYTNFTSGTTEASNLIATKFDLQPEDSVIIPLMEHHSQILTARNRAKKVGASVYYVNTDREDGRLDLENLEEIVNKINGDKALGRKGLLRRKRNKDGKILMNLVHASNVSGVINPVEKVKNILGDNSYIYLDMAQSAGHMPINLDKMGIDFAGVSAHKMYGPMGMGAVFINKSSDYLLSNDLSGGGAVDLVSKHSTAYAKPPERHEPGTQNIEGAIEWSFVTDYLNRIGMDKIEAHDQAIGEYYLGELQKIKGVTVYGPDSFEKGDRSALFAFNVGQVLGNDCKPVHLLRRNYDEVARKLDKQGISVRDGCFCAHPYVADLAGLPSIFHEVRTILMKGGISSNMLKLPGAVRTAFAFYNNLEDAYLTVKAIRNIAQPHK